MRHGKVILGTIGRSFCRRAVRKALATGKAKGMPQRGSTEVMSPQEAIAYPEESEDSPPASRFCSPYYTSHIYGYNSAQAIEARPERAPEGANRRLRVMTSQEAVDL